MIENTFGINIIPENDTERLVALKRYRIMDTPSEESFDNIAKLATQIFNVPIALVSLVDAERVFFKANIGMGKAKEANRGKSLCALAVLSPDVTVFKDALKEPCLMANPNVAGDFGLRFYAGAPLKTKEGLLIGTLCIIDKKVREFSASDSTILEGLSTAIMDQIELRLSAILENEQQLYVNEQLKSQQEESYAINEELAAINEELLSSQQNLEKINRNLEASEHRFRHLIDNAPVAIAIYRGPELIIEEANREMLNIWGKTSSAVGLPLLTARPELMDHPYLDHIRNALRGQEHTGYSVLGPLNKNDKVTIGYFDVIYKPLMADDDNLPGVLVMATDVTEQALIRKREEEMTEELAAINEELMTSNEELVESQQELTTLNDSLNKSEAGFRLLIEQSPVAMGTLVGQELIVDVVNANLLKIWGKDISIVGQPLHKALPEIEGQPFLEILNQVFTTGKAFYGQEQKATLEKNGKLEDCFLNFVYQPLTDINGATSSILLVANDVTEQVDSRKQVDEINTRLQIALDASQLGSTEVDLASGTMSSTDQFKKNYGYAAHEEFNYPDLFNAMFPDYREHIKNLVKAAIDTNGIYQAEYPVKWRDGSIHWIQAHGRPRYDDNGKANRMVGMTADITERKLFEQQKDDFLSIASHELKTPITSLKGSLQLLDRMKDKPMSPIHTKLIEQSNRSLEKMSVLVDDLLNLNRMSEGQLKLEKTSFNIIEMLSTCCSHVRIEDKYELQLEGEQQLKVFADEHRIDQVIINFVNNAIKYAPESMTIYLRVEKINHFAKISVRDNGPGIPDDILPHLFDRYYRADYSGQSYTGLGLGLYICSEIVKRHGGQIGAESEIGQGSTFWFTLPL